ncbi:uncharacterized protein LOC130097227 [Rhinichthys klamathensis goyatoka]|uniref:uncharacterized protein LOC130097227 n=1 Tax=Rhinichthys klamathensis goyatoka TaxID=3034132 RepID=UPI0024B5E759|nr:uncharacterized protein LOC130097227 [Rhinichthys klamathensis goyatoka]
MAQRERTEIRDDQRNTLKSFYKEGMTGVGSPLVQQAVAATGLDICVIQNWIGNYKRSQKGSETRPSKPKFYTRDLSPYNLFCRDVLRKKGTMKDIKGRWSTLEEKQKDKYKQEAAALRAQGQDFSIEMRELKIKKNLNQLKLQVSKLEELGVETAILSFDRQKSGLEVYEVSSKGAADFLDSTDTANNFALHFKANSSCPTDSTTHSNKGQVNDLVKKVQDLFNQRYKEAGGSGRLPYQALLNRGLTVVGLPNGLGLRKPSFYGRNQLDAILKDAEQISFEISESYLDLLVAVVFLHAISLFEH